MNYIDIKGYKSIKDAHLELKPINILIGANGSGKSNFLSFFEFLNALYERKLHNFASEKGINKILHKGIKVTQDLKFRLAIDDESYLVEIKNINYTLLFNSEETLNKDEVILNTNTQNLNAEALLRIMPEFKVPNIKKYLGGIKKYHFHDTGTNSPFQIESNIEKDVHFLYEDGKNIAAFLFKLREDHYKKYNIIIEIIQSVAPYFSDFYLEPNVQGNVRLFWKDMHSSTIYSVNDLSDGTLRFIALTTLFMQPKLPSAIIIDEPELGLHPFAISKLAGMIQSAASKDCQVIVATQSPDLISHFKPEDIITVDQIDGETQFKRLNSIDLDVWLEEYSIDDLWKRSIITTGQPN